MKVIDKLVTEWAFRCKKGYPDINNPDDMKILKEIYSEFGITLEAKEEKPSQSADDYVQDPQSQEHLYVRTKDIDNKTNKPLANARRYRYLKKDKGAGPSAKYVPILTPEEHKAADEKTKKNEKIVNENDYVKSILTQAKAGDIADDIIYGKEYENYYKKAVSIEDFVENKDKYIKAFANLYSYKIPKGGLGELIPLVAIQGARIGGANGKDIVVGGKTLEVKEIVTGGTNPEFALASTAGIAGTAFQQHLETFKKAIKPFRFLPQFRAIDVGVVDVNRVPREYLLTLEKLLANFPYNEKSLDKQSKEIKIGDKKYTVNKGTKYVIEIDDQGNLVQTENTPKQSQQVDTDIRKLLNHPWVKKESSPMGDLEIIRQNYFKLVNYLMLWTSDSTAVIIDTSKSEQTKAIPVNRVTLGNLTLSYSGKRQSESESKPEPKQ